MNVTWEPGVAQAMQRHGGSNHSVPKISAPKIQPGVVPDEHPPMEQQAPLAPAMPSSDNQI